MGLYYVWNGKQESHLTFGTVIVASSFWIFYDATTTAVVEISRHFPEEEHKRGGGGGGGKGAATHVVNFQKSPSLMHFKINHQQSGPWEGGNSEKMGEISAVSEVTEFRADQCA